jgi:enoyl-CoA hydratase/carnithine racemase
VLAFLRAISTATKPVVAAVNGPAVGVGTTMLLHCDLVYAGEAARFQLPFVNLGLVPEAGSSLLLPATIGYQRAAELLLLGEPFSAVKAHAYGIVTEVVADGETVAAATEVARKLVAKPPVAVRLSKMLMKKPTAEAVAQQILDEAEQFERQLVRRRRRRHSRHSLRSVPLTSRASVEAVWWALERVLDAGLSGLARAPSLRAESGSPSRTGAAMAGGHWSSQARRRPGCFLRGEIP